jgi:DNA-binding response OmpR family regulator
MEAKKKTILVVDDDKSILSAFLRFLEKAGYVVETAETGREALDKAQAKSYDVALVDVGLEDMDGTDLLLKLKGINSELVIVVITGFSTNATGIRAADFGADDYLVKPVKPNELLRVIEERLQLRKSSNY